VDSSPNPRAPKYRERAKSARSENELREFVDVDLLEADDPALYISEEEEQL
jgi:hypothetical protein